MNDPKPAKPVNKRGAARLAAVQALYQMDLTNARLVDVVQEYEDLRIGKEIDGETYLEADNSWFKGIVAGVVERQKIIDPVIHNTLPDDWPLKRIDTLLRCILRAGVFELQKRKDVPAKVVINEYVEVTHAFFDIDEARLVNGVLDRIAHDTRADEFEAPGD